MSSANGNATVTSIAPTTNEQILRLLFEDQWVNVLVASFLGDPSDPALDRSSWQVAPAGRCLDEPYFDTGNTYFCPMLFTPGTRRRRGLDNAVSLNVIIIDDIGTKIDLVTVTDLLRSGPTYLIETSPGNYQAGWKCTGLTDMAWTKGMLAQLDRALGGQADNLTNPIALRRLPVGWNRKAALGPNGWRVRCRVLRPDRVLDLLDFPDIEARIGTIVPMSTLNRGTGNGQRPDAAVLAEDPIFQALDQGGQIIGEKTTSDGFWAATIRCPWIAEHGPTRPLDGAEYVPAADGKLGWFKCFHCERKGRNTVAFKEQLDAVLIADNQLPIASFEFQDYLNDDDDQQEDPSWSSENSPWDNPKPEPWPGDVLKPAWEMAVTAYAVANGYDPAALLMSFIGAGSAAADKRARFKPYRRAEWRVPPVLWVVQVAGSGHRKTAIWQRAMAVLTRLNNQRMAVWGQLHAAWSVLPPKDRKIQPEPQTTPLIVNDATVEALQFMLANNLRGVHYARDEFVGILEFDRYQAGGKGHNTRAFFLECYEGGSFSETRMGRKDLHIDQCGLSAGGCIQPSVLDKFTDLADDGLLQRTTLVITQPVGPGTNAVAPDLTEIDAHIERLANFTPIIGDYTTDAAGEALIKQTEQEAENLMRAGGAFGPLEAVINKLHGLHARFALVLHLLEDPDNTVIPADTVRRAKRVTQFAFDHAILIYAGAPADEVTRAIASYLIRFEPKELTTRILKTSIGPCKHMNTKELQAAVSHLVDMDWLRPVEKHPNNRRWRVRAGLSELFAGHRQSEEERVERLKEAFNRMGQYRPTKKSKLVL